MTYQEYKNFDKNWIDNFPIFFAFNDEQFLEGMKKINFTKGTDKLVSIGAGGYLKKADYPQFLENLKNGKKRLKTLLKNNTFFKEAIQYELNNHEYCITMDETDALNVFGLTREKLTEKQIEILNKTKSEIME
jgi:hypothetical protein